MLTRNPIKRLIAEGRFAATTGLSFYSPDLVEILAQTGVDGISVDAEHGALSEGEIVDMTRVAELYGLPMTCRVPSLRSDFILRVLDGGVTNIVVPHVTDAAMAARAVQAVRFPPVGRRGLGNFTRATGNGRLKAAEYVTLANAEIMLIVQIEDRAGLDNVEAIAATDGVDAIFIGANDLALDLGYPGGADQPEVQAAIDRIITVSKAAGRAIQVVSSTGDAEGWIARGAQILALGWQSAVTGGFARDIKRIKNA